MSCALAGAAIAGAGAPASAQDIRRPSSSVQELENEIALYYWLARMEGDVDIQGVSGDVDSGYAKSSLGLHYELWERDSWGGGIDLFRMVLEDDPDVPAGEGNLKTEVALAEAMFIGRTRSGQTTLDFFGGLRWMTLKSRFEAAGVDEDRSRNYVDPIFGVKAGSALSEWMHLSLRVDFGGFDIGTKLSYNLIFAATVNVSPTVSLGFGWRMFGFEIDDSDHEFDLRLNGPLISAALGF